MRNIVAFGIVALVAFLGLALVSWQDLPTGAVPQGYGEWRQRPYLTVQSPYSQLQKHRPLYLGMYHDCREQADQDAWRCFDRYDTNIAECTLYKNKGCHAEKYLDDCLLMAQASRLNCERFTVRVMHDLGNSSSWKVP